ncbi:MAG: alpha/beta hydrolase [Planctomycetes bacterium]|nr:alpha/beta hydrolase [Planctomycetota bacterium]
MALVDGSFFRPTSKVYDHPENFGLRVEDVLIPSSDGVALHGWFFRARDPIGTIVHCHGNAGNITGHFKFIQWLPECGWNVLCFDYRGFGRSTGKITRAGAVDDTSAAIEYAINRLDIDRLRVCVFGQSLGAVVSIVALAREGFPIAGACFDGPFSSFRREAAFVTRRAWHLRLVSGLIARYLISDDLSAIDYVASLPMMPKLFICGTHDPIVEAQQTIDLHAKAPDPKELWVIEGSGHTEAVRGEIEGGRERVLEFFNRCVPVQDAVTVRSPQ